MFLNLPILSLLLLWTAALSLLPNSRRVGVSPTSTFLYRGSSVSSSAGEEAPSPLRSPFAVPSAISPPTLPSLAPKQDGFGQWFSMTANASLAKNNTHSGHLYSALLPMWFASTLTRGFGFSSEWGLLQLKIRAGWRDEVDQSTGKIQEKWLCSSPRLGLILPPTVQKCSLLGMKPFTTEPLQAQGNQPAPKALNTLGLASALRLKVQKVENLQKVQKCEWEKAEPRAEWLVTADSV